MLNYGKLEKFPLEWYTNLIRIGNINTDNPNHFFHAVFYSLKSFRDLSFEDRLEYIKNKRNEIAEQISISEWKKYDIDTQLIINAFQKYFQKSIKNPQNKIFEKIVPDIDKIFDEININNDDDDNKQLYLSQLSSFFLNKLYMIEKKEHKSIDKDKKLKCIQLFNSFLEHVWNETEESIFNDFILLIKDENKMIDIYLLPLIISYLPYNIYFIDYEMKDVISFNDFYENLISINNKNENIILLYQSPSHFECLGIMDVMENETVMISRILSNTHPFILKCREHLLC